MGTFILPFLQQGNYMNTKTRFLCIIILLYLSCIKLDFFVFENDTATSVEKDYHGLPLYVGINPPQWIDSTLLEKEIYLNPSDGKIIPKEQLSSYDEYIHGVFMAAPDDCPGDQCPLIGKSVTFLYTHGNSGTLFRYWYRAVALWSMGANVFIFNYRGYGLSKGEPTRSNIKNDARIAASYIKTRQDVDTNKIIVYGYSMGAIPASYLAGSSSHKNRFAGVILESGLDSPEKILHLSTGTEFPGGFFFDDSPFNGPDFIKSATIPILHIHGAKDDRVIIDQAYSYYDVLKNSSNYTHYIGKTTKPDEEWIRTTGHRNVTIYPFSAEKQISDYWDDAQNPCHCCVHPDEYTEPGFQGFLTGIGNSDGAAMAEAAKKYESLIATWVLSVIP